MANQMVFSSRKKHIKKEMVKDLKENIPVSSEDLLQNHSLFRLNDGKQLPSLPESHFCKFHRRVTKLCKRISTISTRRNSETSGSKTMEIGLSNLNITDACDPSISSRSLAQNCTTYSQEDSECDEDDTICSSLPYDVEEDSASPENLFHNDNDSEVSYNSTDEQGCSCEPATSHCEIQITGVVHNLTVHTNEAKFINMSGSPTSSIVESSHLDTNDILVNEVKKYLKDKYCADINLNNSLILGNLSNYVTLQLIDFTNRRKKLFWFSKQKKFYRNDFSQLFKFSTKHRCKRVIIEGAPGYGKSFLAKRMAYDWINHYRLKDYNLVFLIELKSCSVRNVKELIFQQLLNKNGFNDYRNSFVNYLNDKKNHEKILFILDGYDEINEGLCKTSIQNLLDQNEFEDSTVILTSRPLQVESFSDKEFKFYRLAGFLSPKRRKAFITKYFKNDENHELEALGKKVNDFFLGHTLIKNLTINPLFLTLICKICKEKFATNDKKLKLPHTLTNIYCLLFDHLKNSTVKKILTNPEDRDNLAKQVECALIMFGSLCFQSVLKHNVGIPKTHFDQLKDATFVRDLGFLKRDVNYNGDVVYHPLHQTFLEFLMAYYLSTLDDENLKFQIQQICSSQQILKKLPWDVFSFLAGLIKDKIVIVLQTIPKDMLSKNQYTKEFLQKIIEEFDKHEISVELQKLLEILAPETKFYCSESQEVRAYLDILL